MSRARTLISCVPFVGCVLTSLAASGIEVTANRIGEPTWKPVDFHLFSAPADSQEVFFNTLSEILPDDFQQGRVNTHVPSDTVDAVFNSELGDGLRSAGIEEASVFSVSDIDGRPNGVYWGWILVPDPGIVGKSHNGYDGPVIPRELFPLAVDGDALGEGTVVDPDFDFPETFPFPELDGASHHPMINATIEPFFPRGTELIGNYEYRSVIRDQDDNGWDIVIPFRVVGGGDFNANGQLDSEDIDLLTQEVLSVNPVRPFDLNGDDQVDQTDREFWVEQVAKTWFGDSNLDGGFDSTDLVTVFQAGQYEDQAAKNSLWSTGDWNGDLEFDSADFVTAFQDGGYEQGPRQAAHVVPEPTGIVVFAWGLATLATFLWRRKS